MHGTLLEIQRKDVVPDVNNPFKGFTLVEGATIDAQTIVESPHVSPFWFDDENRRVILVETPDDVDLSSAAFLSDAQYKHAHLHIPVE